MGSERPFSPGLLVVAALRSPDAAARELDAALASLPLALHRTGPELPFAWTGYYAEEMGEGLARTFHVSRETFDPSGLAETKRATDALEASLVRTDGRRRFNLDPGFLSLGGFFLATTKDRAHRIPLRDGIFAELTLLFEAGDWQPLPWTYVDWKSPEYLGILRRERLLLREILRAAHA